VPALISQSDSALSQATHGPVSDITPVHKKVKEAKHLQQNLLVPFCNSHIYQICTTKNKVNGTKKMKLQDPKSTECRRAELT